MKFPRPSSPSVFAYCRRSKTGGVEGLGMRLVSASAIHECTWQLPNPHNSVTPRACAGTYTVWEVVNNNYYHLNFSTFTIITWCWQEEKGQRLGWFEDRGVVRVGSLCSGHTRYRPCQLPPMGGLLVPIYHSTDSHSSNQYILHVLTVVVKMSIICLFATSKLKSTTSFIHSSLWPHSRCNKKKIIAALIQTTIVTP